ncbi:MAG: discoidin domain-containing protein [Phycisphaerales bacterium]|nr:MAG: discoidin domain-containing protein [Phycisphaerales bacterium]
MTTVRASLCFGAVLLVARAATVAAGENYAEHFAMNIGAPVWNSAPTFTESVADEMNDVGVTWIRMEFIRDFTGDFIDYGDYDEIVNRAGAHGLKILALVDYQTKQYSVQSDWENDAWQDSFRDRVVEIVNHYKDFPSGPIKFWEVWNEPDAMGGMSAAKFGRLLSITYPAIKSADPLATVVSGGLTGHYYNPTSLYLRDVYSSSYFSDYKSAHGIYPFDILGLHPYDWQADPDTYLAGDLNAQWNVRWRMNHYGDSYKRIWFTEYGWNTSSTAPTSINPGGTQAENETLQATYLEHAYAIAQPLTYPGGAEYGPYVEKTFLFCYKDFYIGTEEWFGVVDGGGDHKPSYGSYKALTGAALQDAALQATVTACGEDPPDELAVCACDGTPFTKWACLHTVDDHTLTLDLHQAYLVHEFRLAHAEMNHEPDYLNTKSFEIQSSATGGDPWVTEFAVDNADREPVNILTYVTDKELRHIRLRITDANDGGDGWARIAEFEVWGVPVEAPPPPTNPADFDDDGDADLADFSVFAHCFTGSGVTTTPPGCETVPPVPTSEWEAADTVGELSQAISGSDLLHGMIGALEAGGFHEATPGGVAGGLVDLTDGIEGTQAEAVLADYDDPSLQVRYDFATPRDISHIHVFAANETNPGNGRVFQHYDIEYSDSGAPSLQPLIRQVTTGPFGRSNDLDSGHPDYIGATLTRIDDPGGGPIALNVDSLRFIFHAVANIEGTFLNEPDAYVASLIKEIDVFEHTAPLTGNIADMDGDDDVDLDDFGAMEACMTGPGDDPGNPPSIPDGCL